MLRHFTRPLSLAFLPFMAAGALAACSSDDSDGAADSGSEVEVPDAGQPASDAPADLIVDDTVTPDGYDYNPPAGDDEPSLAELFGELSDDPEMADAEGLVGGEALGDVTQADPLQCTGLAVDALTVMDWMFRPAATTATAGYTLAENDEDGLYVMVTTDDVDPGSFPADISECAEFTRNMSDETESTQQHYSSEPLDVPVEGAEVLGTARVTLTGVDVNGEAIDGEGLGTSLNTVTAAVDGVTFTVAASEATSVDLLSSIASAQAQRIANA